MIRVISPAPVKVVRVSGGIRGPAGPPGDGAAYVTAQILAHSLSLNPHPVYDDMPDLTAYFENGLA